MEQILSLTTVTTDLYNLWEGFLVVLTNFVNKSNAQTETIDKGIDNELLKPLTNHFSRFQEIKSQSLLSLFYSHIELK